MQKKEIPLEEQRISWQHFPLSYLSWLPSSHLPATTQSDKNTPRLTVIYCYVLFDSVGCFRTETSHTALNLLTVARWVRTRRCNVKMFQCISLSEMFPTIFKPREIHNLPMVRFIWSLPRRHQMIRQRARKGSQRTWRGWNFISETISARVTSDWFSLQWWSL